MLQNLSDLAHAITEGAKANGPALQAHTDQIHAQLRETFTRHGIALNGALGCVVLEMAQSLLRMIVERSMGAEDPLETTVEVVGAVAEWAAALVDLDRPDLGESEEKIGIIGTYVTAPAYVTAQVQVRS